MNAVDMNLGLVIRDGRAVVSSRDVARVFEKEHKNILADIRLIVENQPEFSRLNFQQSTYANGRGKEYPEYQLTRDGFTFLAMGFTGEKADRFKIAYINAFNAMERRLAAPTLPMNYKEALLALVASEEEKEKLAARNRELELPAAKYEAQMDKSNLYYIGEIAGEFGTTAIILNRFLHGQRVQYKPNGSRYIVLERRVGGVPPRGWRGREAKNSGVDCQMAAESIFRQRGIHALG